MKSAEPKVSGWKIWACYRAVRIFGRWAFQGIVDKQ